MALTITATAGSATANSFVTVAEVDTYIEARINSSAWTGTEPKKQAVVEATRELNLLTFIGTRTDSTQALSWPRTYALNPDLPSAAVLGDLTELYFADTVIPQRVKDATCELAFQFLKSGTTDLAALDATTGIISKTVDVLSTTWAAPSQRPVGLARFPRVLALIDPLLDSGSGGGLEIQRV